MNNTFSFSRFGMVLKRDLIENRGRYLGTFFILFIAFLVFQLHDIKDIIEMSLIRTYEQGDYMGSLATDCKPLFYGLLSLSLMCAAADMTSVPMGGKTSATNYMMMPATNLEKFLSRVFINVVLVIILAYAALFLADLVRMLFVPFYEIKEFYGFTVPRALVAWMEPLKEIYIDGASGYEVVNNEIVYPYWKKDLAIMAVSFVVILTLWAHSLFVLGGCFWRKKAMLKMFFIGLALILTFAWLVGEMKPTCWQWFNENVASWLETNFDSDRDFNRFIFSIGIPLFLGFIALNWWLSFRLFSRKQIVARGVNLKKLINKAHS